MICGTATAGGPILEPALGIVTKRGTGDVAGASTAVDTDGTVVIAGASGFVDTEGTVVIAGASGFVDTEGTVVIAGASGSSGREFEESDVN